MVNSLIKLSVRTKPFQRFRRFIRGNSYGISSMKSMRNVVNLEYSHRFNLNLGDALSPVVVRWMLQQENITLHTPASETKHLMAIGSIIDRGSFDATVWGSGMLTENSKCVLRCQHGIRKLDIRAVRGPLTRNALIDAGFSCPEVFGDPATLLPLIYTPSWRTTAKNAEGVGLVLHHSSPQDLSDIDKTKLKQINISTADYQGFVDSILRTERIISSSLHGIIIAESYGIPAVYLKGEGAIGKQRVKFDDWYQSTNRYGVEPAKSIQDAIDMDSPELPDISRMQEDLIHCFPYDLWDLEQ